MEVRQRFYLITEVRDGFTARSTQYTDPAEAFTATG